MSQSRLKKYHITTEMLAKWLGYSSAESFRTSTANERIVKGLEKLIAHVEQEIIQSIDR